MPSEKILALYEVFVFIKTIYDSFQLFLLISNFLLFICNFYFYFCSHLLWQDEKSDTPMMMLETSVWTITMKNAAVSNLDEIIFPPPDDCYFLSDEWWHEHTFLREYHDREHTHKIFHIHILVGLFLKSRMSCPLSFAGSWEVTKG